MIRSIAKSFFFLVLVFVGCATWGIGGGGGSGSVGGRWIPSLRRSGDKVKKKEANAITTLNDSITVRSKMNVTTSASASVVVPTTTTRSLLFPRPMDMIRRGMISEVRKEYSPLFPYDVTRYDGTCSCRNPKSTKEALCCSRMIRRNHKMGFALISSLQDKKHAFEFDIDYDDNISDDSGSSIADIDENFSTTSKQLRQQPQQPQQQQQQQHAADVVSLSQAPLQFDYLGWRGFGQNKTFDLGDWRLVILLRDVYDSLCSGYLYHKEGMECTKDMYGHPIKGQYPTLADWIPTIERIIPDFFHSHNQPHHNNRTLCTYLAEESEEVGMYAYIQYIFHRQWFTYLDNLALSHAIPVLQERTLSACYEDLISNEEYELKRIHAFYRNQTIDQVQLPKKYKEYQMKQEQKQKQKNMFQQQPHEQRHSNSKDANGRLLDSREQKHATSHDPQLRQRLHDIILDIDKTHYNNDIAWLHTTFSCL